MGGLYERDAALSAVRDVLADAQAGRGRSLLVAGPAGIGRSALAAEAQETARAGGFGVLSSCPTPVSPGLPHVLVRDWLGALVRTGRLGTPPLDGPAAELAEAMTSGSRTDSGLSLATVDYALTWVLESLAATHPLLLVVDDVQWLDPASLQLLDLLSARLPVLGVALLATLRAGEPCAAPDVLDRVAARATALTPAALSPDGVERLRREQRRSAAAALPAEELHRLTGGVPFLVHEVLRSGGHEPVPREVVEWVRDRLARLGPKAVSVARSAAVLGEEAALDAVARLSGLAVADLADPVELLVEAGILTTEPWRAAPVSPLLGDAVLSAATASERSELHRVAAAYLEEVGAPAPVVAEHLVHTLPGEDPAVVALLRQAGEEALDAGAPEEAAPLLLRAVAETRPDATDASLLALAASAHLLSGRPAQAFELWASAVNRAADPATRRDLLLRVGDARMAMGSVSGASEAYRRAAEAFGEAADDASSPEPAGLVLRRCLARAWREGTVPEAARDAAERARERHGADTHADRVLLSLAAFDLTLRGEDRTAAHALAVRALGGGALLREETADGLGFYTAPAVLAWSDAYAEALQSLNSAVKDAHQRGSVLGIATASYCRGLVHYRQGRLRQARGDFQPALCLRAHGWTDFGESAVAGAALTHLALGNPDEALALEPALRAAAAHGTLVGALPLLAAGAVRASRGDHEHALRDFGRAGRLMGPHPDNGSVVAWRELSARSLQALGRRDEAGEVALEAVHHARRWGAPRGLGLALRALAGVTERERGIELLRESLTHLDRVGCIDERARAWADLARLLLDGGKDQREEGIDLLRRTLEYGRVQRVPSAAFLATGLLAEAGEQVSSAPSDPTASLTPGERRVVELAVAGDTNRQIAQKLLVTVKAVEWHLSHAYRKLRISSRTELAAVLHGEAGPSSSSAR